MENVNLDFEAKDRAQQNPNDALVAIAEVKCNNEQKAESILDDYLEENYPEYGREESHFNEYGVYYFNIIK